MLLHTVGYVNDNVANFSSSYAKRYDVRYDTRLRIQFRVKNGQFERVYDID